MGHQGNRKNESEGVKIRRKVKSFLYKFSTD